MLHILFLNMDSSDIPSKRVRKLTEKVQLLQASEKLSSLARKRKNSITSMEQDIKKKKKAENTSIQASAIEKSVMSKAKGIINHTEDTIIFVDSAEDGDTVQADGGKEKDDIGPKGRKRPDTEPEDSEAELGVLYQCQPVKFLH